MTSATLFKIGFTGMGISVVAAIAPVVMAVLGHPKFTEHLGIILNEKSLSIILIVLSAIIFLAVKKKREESILASIEAKQAGEKR